MADVIRLTISGAMPGGETWSVNPVFSVEPPGLDLDFTEVQAIATAAAAVVPPADLRSMNIAGVTITNVKVEARTYAGVLEALAESAIPGPTFGTSASRLPYQSSLVFSLRTSTPGGRGRGRLYWPATGLSLDSTTLRISTPTPATIAAAAKSYLTGLRGAVRATVPLSNLVVWSRASGNVSNVTSLLVGDIVDTQRRRRDALAEGYVTTPITP